MDIYYRLLQLILFGLVAYLGYRLFRVEERLNELEHLQSQEQARQEDEEAQNEEVSIAYENQERLIEPAHLSQPISPGRLRRMKLGELTQVAQDKNISLTDSEGKKLNKTSLIDKISSSIVKDV